MQATDTDTNTQFVKQTDFLTLLANACLQKGTPATVQLQDLHLSIIISYKKLLNFYSNLLLNRALSYSSA